MAPYPRAFPRVFPRLFNRWAASLCREGRLVVYYCRQQASVSEPSWPLCTSAKSAARPTPPPGICPDCRACRRFSELVRCSVLPRRAWNAQIVSVRCPCLLCYPPAVPGSLSVAAHAWWCLAQHAFAGAIRQSRCATLSRCCSPFPGLDRPQCVVMFETTKPPGPGSSQAAPAF